MKLKYILLVLIFGTLKMFSQEKQKVLFSINNEPIYTNEFLNVYKKNLNLIQDSENNSAENYLKLFVDYKLKIKQAKELRIDTLNSFKIEISKYTETLVAPYLLDEAVTNKLVKEAYNRLLKEVSASHILIFAKEDALPADTLNAYKKLIEARNLILKGTDFAKVAQNYSQDPSVKQNGGKLGYFTAMQMVYPFENVAFSTQVDSVSMPFRTKYGFHILKVNDIRASKGEVEVAHIMLKKLNESNKQKMDSIYNLLAANKVDFYELAKKVSEDASSAVRGGKMKKFSYGRMVEDFAKKAFSLENDGDISKPFKTKYGWHIAKLIKKYPVESFEKIENDLKQKIKKDARSNLIGKSVINKLFKEYKIEVNKLALDQFYLTNWKSEPSMFTSKLLTIQNKTISQEDFINHLKKSKNISINKSFEKFKENEVLTYYKENLKYTNPKFAATLKEFEEGLMLFELLEQKVWDKSKDSIGLNNFYVKNKAVKYSNKDLKDIRGIVISDYQNLLEKQWIQSLHQKYTVDFNKSQKKKVIKHKF